MPKSHADTDALDADRHPTAFQQHILTILAEEPRYGLAVKEELETYYQDEVNHGRLYPNLDGLVSEGLVEKSALDKRTNLYELTTEGQQTVFNRVEWILSKYATSDSRASAVSDLVGV